MPPQVNWLVHQVQVTGNNVVLTINVGGFSSGNWVEISGFIIQDDEIVDDAIQQPGAVIPFSAIQAVPDPATGSSSVTVNIAAPGLVPDKDVKVITRVAEVQIWPTGLQKDSQASGGVTRSRASEVPASARPLTIGESTYLLQTCNTVVSLLTLDEMWSVYLTAARGDQVAEADFSGLLELSDRMHNGLGELVGIGHHAADLVSSQSDEALTAGLQRLRDQYGPAELFDWLLDQVAAGTSLREVFLSAWNWILSNVDDERENLLTKRQTLAAYSLPDPDFRFRFKCFLVVAGIGAGTALAAAGTVATLGVGAVVGLGVLAVAGGTALAWKDTGCGGEVRRATRAEQPGSGAGGGRPV